MEVRTNLSYPVIRLETHSIIKVEENRFNLKYKYLTEQRH